MGLGMRATCDTDRDMHVCACVCVCVDALQFTLRVHHGQETSSQCDLKQQARLLTN